MEFGGSSSELWALSSELASSHHEALHERLHDEVPAVDEDEEQQFQGQRDRHGRHHHHAERHQHRGDEKVEDEETATLLREMGVDYLQGERFGGAEPLEPPG